VIDLGAELLAALRSPAGREALAEALGPVIWAAVREALEARETDRLVGLDGLGQLLGCSADAAKMRCTRDAELAGLAVRVGSRRRWRRSEVMALLATRRGGGR
jgi:hypothetical protein